MMKSGAPYVARRGPHLDRRKVETPEGKPVELTRTEFDLLAFFKVRGAGYRLEVEG